MSLRWEKFLSQPDSFIYTQKVNEGVSCLAWQVTVATQERVMSVISVCEFTLHGSVPTDCHKEEAGGINSEKGHCHRLLPGGQTDF